MKSPTNPDGRAEALSRALRALRRSHDELQQTQLQLVQAARLESIGRLAAGVAHEVKNPLAIVLGAVQLLKLQLPESSGNTELLTDMESAVRRANAVVMGLLDFARSSELDLEEASLDHIVDGAVGLVHLDAATRRIHIRRESQGDLPRLRIDRMKIEQVLINFLMNAIDAMESGGTITVRTRMRQLVRSDPGVGHRKSDLLRIGQTVAEVRVEDEGPGLRPEVLRRAFEPFYTTKGPGKGTGLGLAVSRTIAGLHRGTVMLENRAEGGTCATLWLPASQAMKEAA